jgi:hypothetical protein
MLALKQGIIMPLVDLLKSRNMTVQVKVGMALESLAINNQATQNAILQLDAPSYIIKLLEVSEIKIQQQKSLFRFIS